MAIQLITDKDKSKIELTKENSKEVISDLEKMLKPGTPVMFMNASWSSIPIVGGRHSERFIFFSDGKLTQKGVFGIQKGERNYSYISASEKDPARYVILNGSHLLSNYPIVTPQSDTMQHFNEGTFSPAGGCHWNSIHTKGTEEIMVGDIVYKRFPEAMNALRFARDAILFTLGNFYLMDNCISTNNEPKNSGKEQYVNSLMQISVAKRLIKARIDRGLIVSQIGRFIDGAAPIRKRGIPVDEEDYLIQELSHPGRNIAYVKVNRGAMGCMYVLPASKEMERLVEDAFSKDAVKRYFPEGAQ